MSDQINVFKTVIERLNELAVRDSFAIGDLQRNRSAGKKRAFKKIFTGHSTFDNYAYHTGGRSEIQFNIGIENHEETEDWFRYGLAFSLQGGISLKDPIGTFAPRIQALNKYIRENIDNLNDVLLWKNGEVDEAPRPLHPIPSNWIDRDTFIFLGKYIKKSIKDLEDKDLLDVLVYLDRLLPIYNYVENKSNLFAASQEHRVSKICWNTNGWRKPSGSEGKSEDKSSHEYQYGYGHEEWLFDFDKIIEGYHYAYLQPIGKHRNKYTGEIFEIDLFSFNSVERRSYWLAKLKSVEVIDREEEKKAITIYKEEGWLKEMHDDLKDVGADIENFEEWIMEDELFNIRFRPQDVYGFGAEPVPFADAEKISHRRYTLLYQDHEKRKPDPLADLVSGVNRKEIRDVNTHKRSQRFVECSQLHNKIQNSLLDCLRNAYPKEKIELEGKTAYGTSVDLYRKAEDGLRYFYEVKTYPSAKACIREALGQLLEYAFYPECKRADYLVIVSQAPLSEDDRSYICHLKNQFPFPLGYIQFDHENANIIEEL